MKKVALILLMLSILIGNTSAQQKVAPKLAANTPANGKEFLSDYYSKTFQSLSNSVEGLSSAQLEFKPAADRWSISQCLEHILLTEKALFNFAKEAMAKPANPERRSEVKTTDDAVIQGLTDRSFKAKAGDALTGKGAYRSPTKALDDLRNERKEITSYINEISVDSLRSHVSDSPFGPIDAYQSLLFVAGHTARHTLQIEEVKADKKFPKK
jgi:hypothetical protein